MTIYLRSGWLLVIVAMMLSGCGGGGTNYATTGSRVVIDRTVPSERARMRGAIIGSAVGDAIGRKTEFVASMGALRTQWRSPEDVTLSWYQRHGTVTCGNGKICIPYTDDTLMAKAVLIATLGGRIMEQRRDRWQSQMGDNKGEMRSRTDGRFEALIGNIALALMIVANVDRAAKEKVTPEKDFFIFFKSLNEDAYTMYLGAAPEYDPLYEVRAHGIANVRALAKAYELLRTNYGESHSLAGSWWNRAVHDTKEEIGKQGGCGSVMRAWPIGLVYRDNPALACDIADEQSKITHAHPMARAACRAVVAGVAAIARGERDIDAIIDRMIAEADRLRDEIIEFRASSTSNPAAQKKLRAELATPYREGDFTATRDRIAHDVLLPGDMIRYGRDAAKYGVPAEQFFGTHNEKQGPRSAAGYILGWSADEDVAAAAYLLKKYGEVKNGLWLAMQEGAWTPGDSDSIAAGAGVLVGGYRGLEVPASEQNALAMLEDYQLLLALADKVADLRPLSVR